MNRGRRGSLKSNGKPKSLVLAGKNSKNDVEVICLTDSEENVPVAVLPKGTTTPKSTKPATVSSNAVDMPSTPPQPDIERYYLDKGISLSHVRRLNRNYVRHDGPGGSEAGGLVYWDSYSPPPGFKDVELPPLENSQSQPKDEPVSPAILNAELFKRKPNYTQAAPTEEEYNDLLNKLLKRKAGDDKENSFESPNKRITPDKRSLPSTATSNAPQLFEGTGTSGSLNASSALFPDGDDDALFPDADDLNDSALIRCTQAAELAFEQNNNNPKLNKNFPNKQNDISPVVLTGVVNKALNRATGSGPMNTSTPLNNSGNSRKSLKGEKSRQSAATPKTSASTSTAWRSRNQIETPPLEQSGGNSSFFENSDCASTSSSRRSRRASSNNIVAAPPARKSLFPKQDSPMTVGDFEDDDDDELFSQINLPDEINYQTNNRNKPERTTSNQTTLPMDESTASTSTDSMFSKTALAEIDRLQEMALNSGNKGRNVSTFTLHQELERSRSAFGIGRPKTPANPPLSRLSSKGKKYNN